MSIFEREIEVKIDANQPKATLSQPLYIYYKDRGLDIYFKLVEYLYSFTNGTNILEGLEGAYASVTIIDPQGYELRKEDIPIEDDRIKFTIDEDMTDELTEIGEYQIQIHVNNNVEGQDTSVFSVPPFPFTVYERLSGEQKIKPLMDEEGYPLDDTQGYTLTNSSTHKVINFSTAEINALLGKVQDGTAGGATFTPSVDESGNLSWTNDKGLENPQPVNIKGLKGDKGDTGATGATGANGITPTLKVGSTSTGNAGTNASVTMTDNNNVYTLNFVIPKGDKGDTGAKGDAGAKGQDGAKGADGVTPTLKVGTVTTLAAGSNATVTMSENNNVYTLNFGIPKGNKGDTGASGGGGETTVINPTITIGTVTNGDTASATITGDSPNYTLNLVLPKGAKGDKGEKGDAGVKGADGAKGDKGDKGDPFTYADFTPEQLATLKGAKGDKGDTGANGITPTIAVGTTATGEAGTNAEVTMSKSGTTYTFNFVIPKGAKGDTGAAGTKGDKGEKGDPFTYADFTSEQLAALKGAKGDKGEKGDTGANGVAGAKGDKGDRGEKGADGVTPTFTIGTITTGAAGSTATVTITGTAPNYVLNFTIPKGDKGDTGEAGSGGDVDLTEYAKLAGATFTGHVTSPIVSATRYFETPTLVGEGDDKTYYHRVVFGHRNFDRMEFHEYGGLFKFIKNTSGKENEGQLLFQISPSDVNSKVPLKENGVRVYSPNNKPTAADLGITTGTNGATFTPAVDDAGNLSWSNDKDLANPNTVNIKGAKGDKGDTGTKGADGQTPNISIGTVTTGAAGSSASAEITGTTPNLTLNLTIPRGAKGDKGDTGATGATGADGAGISKTVKVHATNSPTLTTDTYQYLSSTADITITLPNISSNTEIYELHVFYAPTAAKILTFPSTIKWQGTLPTIEANKVYEFILTRLHTGTWLAGVVVYG